MEENHTAKAPWKNLLKVRVILPVILGSSLLYWTTFERPYLRIDNAKVAAPFVQVRSESKGRLAALHHAVGDHLHEGESLYSLQQREEDALYTSLRANLTSLEGRLGRALSGVEKSMDEYINACAHAEMGLCSSEAAEESLRFLQQEQADVHVCKKNIEQVQVELEHLGKEVAKKTVRAPCSGIVAKLYKSEGESLDSGEAVYAVCDVKRLYIEALVPEKNVGKIAVGQKAVVSLPAYHGRSWTGVVSWISPVAQEDTASVKIHIHPEDASEEMFRPNLSATTIIKVR